MNSQDILLFAPSQRPELRRAHRLNVWKRSRCCFRAPPERLLALCLRKRKVNGGVPAQARSPLPSHLGNPESFPCVCSWGFPGVSLPHASPCGCGSQVCGLGVSTLQGRPGWVGWGKSRQHRLPRKTPYPQGHLIRPGWVPEQTHVSAGSRISSGQKQLRYWSGPAQ